MTAPRQRDSARTRQMLLEAARRRFALDGYAATTVRDIAEEVGVNVALIARYFGSKEGLFEACVEGAVQELGRSVVEAGGLPRAAEAISRLAVGASPERGLGDQKEVLLLLLRSSGDPLAEERRIGVLRNYSLKLASLGGWEPGQPETDDILIRAQLVLSTAVGVVALRASSGLEPLASATEEQLFRPLLDLIGAVLRSRDLS